MRKTLLPGGLTTPLLIGMAAMLAVRPDYYSAFGLLLAVINYNLRRLSAHLRQREVIDDHERLDILEADLKRAVDELKSVTATQKLSF